MPCMALLIKTSQHQTTAPLPAMRFQKLAAKGTHEVDRRVWRLDESHGLDVVVRLNRRSDWSSSLGCFGKQRATPCATVFSNLLVDPIQSHEPGSGHFLFLTANKCKLSPRLTCVHGRRIFQDSASGAARNQETRFLRGISFGYCTRRCCCW
jgi:hypothetical protein